MTTDNINVIPQNGRATSQLVSNSLLFLSLRYLLICFVGSWIFADKVSADEIFRVPSLGDDLVVQLKVSGEEALFLFDTGSAITSINSLLSKKVGPRTRAIKSFDGFEFHDTDLFKPPEIQLGKVIVDIEEVIVRDLSPLRLASGHPIAGIIGNDFMWKYGISIDYDAGELRIHDKTIDREYLKGVRKPCVLTHEPKLAYLYNKIPGNVADDLQPFLIDTGMSTSLALNENLFDALATAGVITNLMRQKAGSSFKTYEVTTGDLLGFEFAGFKHKSLRCVRFKMNVIGQALLARYQVTMDFPRKEIWFRPGKRIEEPASSDLIGIGVQVSMENQVEVAEVQPDSLADKAGIRQNDEILEIDSEAVSKYSLFQLRDRFSKPGECRLKTRRDGKVQEHRFLLAPLKTAM